MLRMSTPKTLLHKVPGPGMYSRTPFAVAPRIAPDSGTECLACPD